MEEAMRCIAVTICLLLLLGAPAAAVDGGTVRGRVELTFSDGRSVPGEWIRLLLVTDAVDAEAIVAAAEALTYEPGVRLNRIHMDFFKAVSRRLQAGAQYLAATSLSAEDGTFAFPPVAPGRYWVLVTFPAMIEGCKVAWQVPVTVRPGKAAGVVLNNDNLLFPLPRPRSAADR
ncbi:MAG: hypothetical protein DRH76_08310 [Deltaproteobacteria bacterium]|nr:MAG: hypothetical protein DRH76_08310 [Deltaproteobacteria bacterium]